ncbi:hypothetical protein B0J14DRAFT_696243 [Halenospora varia]|nr:hypothetical protein B0J14DRAFT_696243 [Halenospora varia]
MHYSYYDLDRTSQEKMERSCASSSSPASAKVSSGSVTAIDMDTFLQDFNQGLVFPEDGPLDARSEALLTALDLSGGAEDTWDGTIKGEEFDPPLIPALVNISGPMVGSRPFDAGTSTTGPVDTWAGILRDYIEPSMETMMPTPLNVSGLGAEGQLVDAEASMMPAPLNVPSPVPDLNQAYPIGRFGTLPTSLVERAALDGVQLPKLAPRTPDEVIAECMAQKARLVAIATARGAPGGEFISAMEMEDDEVCDRIKGSRGLNAGFVNELDPRPATEMTAEEVCDRIKQSRGLKITTNDSQSAETLPTSATATKCVTTQVFNGIKITPDLEVSSDNVLAAEIFPVPILEPEFVPRAGGAAETPLSLSPS